MEGIIVSSVPDGRACRGASSDCAFGFDNSMQRLVLQLHLKAILRAHQLRFDIYRLPTVAGADFRVTIQNTFNDL